MGEHAGGGLSRRNVILMSKKLHPVVCVSVFTEFSDMSSYHELFRSRTKKLTLDVISLYGNLPRHQAARVIGKQLLRSASSVGANYRAVSRARSDAERFSKLCIVVEEIDETVFWLEVLKESQLLTEEFLEPLLKESMELTKVFSVYKSKLKTSLARR